jgi:omega-6 fatty acid desaturase (delta-12 desaturase)
MNSKSNGTINETELFMKYKSSYTSAFIDLSIHSFLICLSFYSLWYFRNSWIVILPTISTGLLNLRTIFVFHDCGHNSYTPNKTLNYIIGSLLGIYLITPFSWNYHHNIHHLTNGMKDNAYTHRPNETVILTYNAYKQKTLKTIVVSYMYRVFFVIFPIIYFVVKQRYNELFNIVRKRGRYHQNIWIILRDTLLNNISCFVFYRYYITYAYFIPFYIAITCVFLLFHNQHTYNPPYMVNYKDWSCKNSGLAGSSFIQIPKFLKYFTMGIEYHHIHHMNAKIPGYNLQAYHEEVVSKSNLFDNVVKLSMNDCYNNLWLFVYHEDKNRYITFAEADEEIIQERLKIQ